MKIIITILYYSIFHSLHFNYKHVKSCTSHITNILSSSLSLSHTHTHTHTLYTIAIMLLTLTNCIFSYSCVKKERKKKKRWNNSRERHDLNGQQLFKLAPQSSSLYNIVLIERLIGWSIILRRELKFNDWDNIGIHLTFTLILNILMTALLQWHHQCL